MVTFVALLLRNIAPVNYVTPKKKIAARIRKIPW